MRWLLALVAVSACVAPPQSKTIFELTVVTPPEITMVTVDGAATPIASGQIVFTHTFETYVAGQAAPAMEVKFYAGSTPAHTGHAQLGACAKISMPPQLADIEKEAILIDGTGTDKTTGAYLDFAPYKWDMLVCFTTKGDLFNPK